MNFHSFQDFFDPSSLAVVVGGAVFVLGVAGFLAHPGGDFFIKRAGFSLASFEVAGEFVDGVVEEFLIVEVFLNEGGVGFVIGIDELVNDKAGGFFTAFVEEDGGEFVGRGGFVRIPPGVGEGLILIVIDDPDFGVVGGDGGFQDEEGLISPRVQGRVMFLKTDSALFWELPECMM